MFGKRSSDTVSLFPLHVPIVCCLLLSPVSCLCLHLTLVLGLCPPLIRRLVLCCPTMFTLLPPLNALILNEALKFLHWFHWWRECEVNGHMASSSPARLTSICNFTDRQRPSGCTAAICYRRSAARRCQLAALAQSISNCQQSPACHHAAVTICMSDANSPSDLLRLSTLNTFNNSAKAMWVFRLCASQSAMLLHDHNHAEVLVRLHNCMERH